MTVSDEVFDVVPTVGDSRVNPLYDRVQGELDATPGKWRWVAEVSERKDAVRWYQAGRRRGWEVTQRRDTEAGGWRVYARVTNNNNEGVNSEGA